MSRLLPIVEGVGDLQAAPLLLRRLLHEVHRRFDVEVLPAQRRGEWPTVKRNFERYYRAALIEQAPIVWMLDFDCEECVDHDAERAWALNEAATLDPRGRVEIVFMVKEYESIFLWDEESLRLAFPELRSPAELPVDPELVRDAKGWITSALPKGRAYKPTTDQARLTARIPIQDLLHASPSLKRLDDALRFLIVDSN
jgi:hypothetical protein